MTDQGVLVLVPIVALIIVVGIAGFFFALKERRESRDEHQTPRRG